MSAPATEVVFCGLCRRPQYFFVRAGLQFRDCECGGLVSLYVRAPEPTRWALLEIDDK